MRAGLADALLPRLLELRDAQMRDREADQTGLGFGAASGRAFIADLAARAGGRAGERRDRGRMIVRLDLHQNIDRLVAGAIDAADRIGKPAVPSLPPMTAALSR